MTLDFINVGYGDAILIRDGAFAALVDCGDAAVGRSCAQGRRVMAGDYLRQLGIRHLDLLVLTHLHLDHAGGLPRILDLGVTVGAFWTNYLPPKGHWGAALPVDAGLAPGAHCLMRAMNAYLSALKRLDRQGTDILPMTVSGQEYNFTPALTAQVYLEEQALHQRQREIWGHVLGGQPDNEALSELDGFINDTSIRLSLVCGGQRVELPGDVYAACWQKHRLAPCTLMKLPHHGHGDAVTPGLLAMLRPQYAVISVSDDRKDNCPSPRVIAELAKAGAQVCFTDGVALPGAARAFHEALRFELTDEGCRLAQTT